MKKLLFLLILMDLFVAPCVNAASEEELKNFLLKNDYQSLIRAAKSLVTSNNASAQVYYLLGLGYLKTKDFIESRRYLELAAQKATDKDLREKAAVSIADTYFLEGDFDQALNKYEAILKRAPQEGILPILYLRLAQCDIKQGKWREGKNYLDKLRGDFPNSLEALMSESLNSTEQFFCVQAGSFTRQENAQNFVNELKAKGFDAYISNNNSGGTALYRVRVGERATRREAEEIKGKLDKLGYDTKIYP